MTVGSHIRAIGPKSAQEAPDKPVAEAGDEPVMLEEEWSEDAGDPILRRRWYDWLVPVSAVLAIAGWTAFFAWAFKVELQQGGDPQSWINWLVSWSIPTLLICSIWLLAIRLSRREAIRFGDTAALLRREADALESRLAIVNRELSLAREFLGTQSRELESFGRIASERLSAHASELQSLIHSNGVQLDTIAGVSDTALSNMGKLRDDLPVIATSSRDVSNQIGQAGRIAHDQVEKLISGFERLNEFGRVSGHQVATLSEHVEASLTRFETQLGQIEQVTENRFAAIAEKSEEFRVDLDGREVNALAAMRSRAEELRLSLNGLTEELDGQEEARIAEFQGRIAGLREDMQGLNAALDQAQHNAMGVFDAHRERLQTDINKVIGRIDQLDQHAVAAGRRRVEALEQESEQFEAKLAAHDAKFAENIARRQDEFDLREAQASEVLAQRLAALDEMLAERAEGQLAQLERLVAQGSAVSEKVDELGSLLSAVTEQSHKAEATLGNGLGEVAARLEASRSELSQTGATIAELTDAGIRLLEIIQSGARETREALPTAIEKAATMLGDVEQRAITLKGTVDGAQASSANLSDYVISARDTLDETGRKIIALTDRLAEGSGESLARIAALREALTDLDQENERISARASEELRASIVQLEEATRRAFAAIEEGADSQLGTMAKEIGAKATAAIEQALRDEGMHAVEQFEEANLRAASSSREIAVSLRDQLTKVNDLATNLEQRVARAREQAQEQVDNDFSRRMALITESLNSNAIDIAKSLSHEVADTAWAAYLKGDRGIFTRRAVRLVDNSEAREIMELFEADDVFREHVSRYIHDFENMLRSVLSTRDGNALGVTLLSSDMGKLYVALAQSIERLRN